MTYSRLYVGRLPRDATEREIRRHFEDLGRLRDVRVLSGFAFVEYEDSRDARDAVDRLDNTRFLGDRIIVEPARAQQGGRGGSGGRDGGGRDRYQGPAGRSKYRLMVENLPSRTSWQNLKDLMRKAGEVTFTDVDRDGVGFVEFSNSRDMDEALRMYDGYDYEGKRLAVKEAGDKDGGRSDRRRDDDRDRRDRRDRDRDDDDRKRRDDDRNRDDDKDDRRDDDAKENGHSRPDDEDDEPRGRRDDRDDDNDDDRRRSLSPN